MQDNTNRDTRMDTSNRAPAGAARLARLDELDGYTVADGEPDIRGWDVKTRAGESVGEVKELIVDVDAMKARYLDVKLDRKAVGLAEDRHVLLPIGTAQLDDDHDDVLIRESAADLRDALPYDPKALTPDYERRLHAWYAARSSSAPRPLSPDVAGQHDALVDDSAFWGKRRGTGGAAYLTRSEEELDVGKRQVKAGEVDVRKRVETERVQREVPVSREEVTVERRPATGMTAGTSAASGTIGSDEIRVPVMAEELVVYKRTVPKEEVIIRKQTVQETKTVEADLKKERVDIRPTGDVDTRDAR